jgi:hypothetical protein
MTMDLTVYFAGVCTHVWWEDPPPAFTHRVVLANGIAEGNIHGKRIRSHIPTLRVADQDILDMTSPVPPRSSGGITEWRLDGARVRIENAITEVERDLTFKRCIPKLGDLTSDIGPPSKEAVDGGVLDFTACIFDVTGGTLKGRANQSRAAFALLETDTSEIPKVHITWSTTAEPTVLHLVRGAEMTIANLGAAENDDADFDFYLHYKLAAEMPAYLGVPGPSDCTINEPARTWPPGFGSVGPGCSNSAYP